MLEVYEIVVHGIASPVVSLSLSLTPVVLSYGVIWWLSSLCVWICIVCD